MSEAIVNASVPLAHKEVIPLILVKDEHEESTLPHRDLLAGDASQGRRHHEPAEVKGGVSTSEEHGNDDNPEEDDDDDQSSVSETSFYEDFFDKSDSYKYEPGDGVCTPEESKHYLQLLRDVGIDQFVQQTVSSGTITARKLCTAFGVLPPDWLADGAGDEGYYKLLGFAIARQLSKREKLPQYNTIDDAAMLLNRSNNILVITGAGISTSLGIPDFRSKETGFYTKLSERGIDEPEELFELSMFDDVPEFFYEFAGETLPDSKEWTPTHQFIKLLQDKGKLLRNYTQNIDNVESNAGIHSDKLVQCHGSWATATCRKCGHKVPCAEIADDVKAKRVPKCTKCVQELASLSARPAPKRKRSSRENSKARKRRNEEDSDSDGQYNIPQPGVMKPDITFFGEKLPNRFFDLIKNVDAKKVDLVIVIGTGLGVAPVNELPGFLGRDTPHIYISKTPIKHIDFDINLLGYCDVVVADLAERAGWELKHKMIPDGQKITVTPREEQHWTHDVQAQS